MTDLRIWAFTMTFWNSKKEAESLASALTETMKRAQYYFTPRHYFLASGTWSEPKWSPLPPFVPVINSGAVLTKPYEVRRWNYSACGFCAALGYALANDDWDLLVMVEIDVLIGAVNFDSILREFMERPEELVGASWKEHLGMPVAWKRSGAARWQHQRKRANLVEDNDPEPMWMEEEFDAIHKGRWWNPWPGISIRQDNDSTLNSQVMSWPFVRCPHDAIVDEYTKTQTPKSKPVAYAAVRE